MDTLIRRIIFGFLLVGVLSIVLSGFALAQATRLSLPFPKAIAILSIIFPIATAAAIPFSNRILKNITGARFNLLTMLGYLSTLCPVILLVLSFIYGRPTSLLTCSLENQWSQLFRNKDQHSIRVIQDTLRCCGFNSVRDRAWPFPSNGVTARECERTQDYHIRCLEMWRREESTVAGMIGVANFSNWVLIVFLVCLVQVRSQWNNIPRFRAPASGPATRLLGARDADEEVGEQPPATRGEVYSDIPDSENREH